jgi:hypothetical protein
LLSSVLYMPVLAPISSPAGAARPGISEGVFRGVGRFATGDGNLSGSGSWILGGIY